MTWLSDYRRFARATVALILVSAAALAALLLVAGRGSAVPGLVVGALVGAVDALLLTRGLDRFARRRDAVDSRRLTVMMMTRFATVGLLIGIGLCARSLNPVGVVTGFLLFPLAIVLTATTALRRQARGSDRRVQGAAG